jgi:cell division protein FtsI/penicillin-binding protein 2
MYGVVNEAGTGVRAHLPGIAVCGKTGSAQVASNEFVKAHKQTAEKDNSWFVGFAQCNNPEIVVAALFQGGEHGMLAAPIVRDVIKAYYDKKARTSPGQPNDPGLPRKRPPEPAPVEPPPGLTGE